MIAPNFDAARDDLMATGFLPTQVSWPLVINITSVTGADFDPQAICPPQDPEKRAAARRLASECHDLRPGRRLR